MAPLSRFDELRIKTEDQLLQLVNNKLDFGMREARQALKSIGTWEDHCLRANRAYTEASRLILLVSPAHKRNRLESRREHLREMLAGLSVLGSIPTRDAVPTLAHALWNARDCPEGSSEEDWFQAEQVLKSHAVCSGAAF
jgi:hypothetical protein